MKHFRVILSVVLLATLTTVVSNAAGSAAPRVFNASGPGVSATVTVGKGSSAKLAYAMRTKCGRSSGKVKLTKMAKGSFKGTSRSGSRLVKAQVTPDQAGLSGLIRYSTSNAKGTTCRAKRSFRTASQSASGHGVKGSTGHYTGQGNVGGNPISYDVSENSKGALEISNLTVRTEAECWEDLDGDGADDVIVVQVDGLGGEVESNGDFYIDVTPNADNWYTVIGTLRDGKAKMEVLVGGLWDLNGMPMANGPRECDSFGEGYTAARQG